VHEFFEGYEWFPKVACGLLFPTITLLALKYSHADLKVGLDFLTGLGNAALKELRFKSRAAVANIVLCFLLGFLAFSVFVSDIFESVRQTFAGDSHPHNEKVVIFIALGVFFFFSLVFVFAQDTYDKHLEKVRRAECKPH
jgi:hypothetical protein